MNGSMNSDQASATRNLLLVIAILLVGAILRFTGLNWDEGQWIHPDEGHMRGITAVIQMPDSLALYFDTHNSPLNCRNSGHRYSYGTLPLFLTRATAEWLDLGCGESPNRVSAVVGSLLAGPLDEPCRPGTFTGFRSAQVGRMLSALADLGTVFLVYLIGRRLYGESVGLLAAAFAALTAFSIQQAHFFTVDSMACFFVTLTVYFSVRAGRSGSWTDFGLAGLATGLATACKVSAALASLLVVLAGVWHWLQRSSPKHSHTPALPHSSILSILPPLILAGSLSLVAFRVAQPYAFEGPGFFGVRPSPEWFERLGQIRGEQGGEVDLPSGRQWTNRAPILFPWINMVVWGMGLPLGLAAWAGWALAGFELIRGKYTHLILWVWGSLMFLYQATSWVKAMRYFLHLYPLFVILAAYLLVRLCRASSRWRRYAGFGLATSVVIGTALWASAVFSIYLRPNTRLAASRWIYDNIPQGVTLANEHWDWGLPLRVDGHNPFGGIYTGLEMHHYNEDTLEKRSQLFGWLDEADYIILASNRLYASIPRLPARYPLTIEYYRALFAGELGFELVADFTSRPAIGPFQFPDQENPFPLLEANYVHQTNPIVIKLPPAEEAFSVYDHPRVLIFRKTPDYSRHLVEEVLGGIDVERALHGLTPSQVTAAPDFLEFDPETWAEQQAGGTWSEMFNRNSLLNRYPALAALAWWVVVTLLGWLAFPLLFVALPHLRDRGYGLARVLGLLLVAYLTWLVASLHVLPNTRGTILRMVLLLALVGGGVGWFR
ncbi:MAG: glycosyltransferase family 39 protein, partial [Chloroflexota bacterium]|nr:glycosyltransferase family 39 protein [Chloroflexota bacterium]